MLAGGTLFVPYGAFGGDCGSFHGWIVGISTADPTRVAAWAARVATGAGVWAPGGMSSDGTSIFFGTGNGVSSAATTWQDTEAIFRLPLSLVRSENSADYFAPTNWAALDATDGDLGGTAPVIVNAPGATPSALLVAFGKDGNGYLLDRANLGGIGGVIGSALLSRDGIINAPVAYTTPAGTYLALTDRGALCPPGEDGFATAVKITKTSPPTLAPAWCTLLIATQTRTAPIVSMTDAQGSNAIVWISASDDKLYGLDGDTGAQIFTSGTTTIPGVSRFVPPIIAKGRIFVASTTQVYAFTAK